LTLDAPKITITYIGFEDAEKSNWLYFDVGKALGPGHHQRRNLLQGRVFLLVFYCLESFLKLLAIISKSFVGSIPLMLNLFWDDIGKM
jgi:hypothetical protein